MAVIISLCMMQNRGELLLPSLQLLTTIDEKSIVNVPHKTIDSLTITCKLFYDALYDSEMFTICLLMRIVLNLRGRRYVTLQADVVATFKRRSASIR